MDTFKFKLKNIFVKGYTAIFAMLFFLLVFSCAQNNKAPTESSNEKMLVGTWVVNSDELGRSIITETYNTDGTWQRGGDSLSIICTGTWALEGKDTIRIHETGVKVGSTFSALENSRFYIILSIDDNQLSYVDGEETINLQRRKN